MENNKRLLKSHYESLSINEQVVLIILQNSTWNGLDASNIKESTIAERSGISLQTVKKHIKKLIDLEYIEKTEYGWRILKKENFEYYCPEVLAVVEYRDAAIANRLAHCRWRDSARILLNQREILKRINVRYSTYKEAYQRLVDAGILIQYKDCLELNTEFYPVVNATLSSKNIERSKALLKMLDDGVMFLGAKVWKYYWENGFRGLRITPDELLVYCEAGCPGMNKLAVNQLDRYEIPFDSIPSAAL